MNTERLAGTALATAVALIWVSTAGPGWAAPEGCETQIAFVSRRDGDAEIFVMDSDGGGVRQITHNDIDDGGPAWSPDGEWIVFARVTSPAAITDEGPPSDIFSVRADGSDETNLTNSPNWHEAAPSWSPDGQHIAFHTQRDGDFEIYSMGADGGDVRNLTRHHPAFDATGRAAADVKPSWSPDGSKIVFESYRDQTGLNSDIWTMNADGSGQAALVTTPFPAPEWYPSWSPDGQTVAYMGADAGRSFDIHVVAADGSGARNVMPTAKTEFGPAWSPDSSRIAFGSNLADGGFDAEFIAGRYFVSGNDPVGPDNFEIYEIRKDGTGLTRLTTNPGEDTDPAYRPC